MQYNKKQTKALVAPEDRQTHVDIQDLMAETPIENIKKELKQQKHN